jgi:hypothetical protein
MVSPASASLDPADILYGDSRPLNTEPIPSWPHQDLLDNFVSDLFFTGKQVTFWSLDRYCPGYESAVANRSLHRLGAPAVEWDDGCWSYYKLGYLHREDGPASHNRAQFGTWKDRWAIEGAIHRDGDLPAVVKSNGDNEWRQHDQLHREGDKPAVIAGDGSQLSWYRDGALHREGGLPAFTSQSRFYPLKTVEWWRHGELITSLKVSDDGWISLNDEVISEFETLLLTLEDAGLILPEPEKYSEPWDQ